MKESPGEALTSDLGLREVLRLQVRLWVLVALVGLAFAGGFLARGLEHQPVRQGPATGSVQQAPPLSDEELEGSLPTGHPGTSEGSTGDVTTGGSR